MATRAIVLWPDPDLRKVAGPVIEFNKSIKELIVDLWDTMRAAKGAGLAAPQIGVPLRVIVVDVSYADPEAKPVAMVNPVVTVASKTTSVFEEGCLSIPGQVGAIERPSEVTIAYQNEAGEAQTLTASGTLAVALQHEIDHLEGMTYPDRLSTLKRDIYRKKAEKAKRNIELYHRKRKAEVDRLKALGFDITKEGRVTLADPKAG